MKLTKTRLKQIIKEEIEKTLHLSEDDTDPYARSWERRATRDQSVVAKDKGTTFKLPELLAKIRTLPSFQKLSEPQQREALSLANNMKVSLKRGKRFNPDWVPDLVPTGANERAKFEYHWDLYNLFKDFSLEY